jgi:hypothetical protein
MSYHFKLIILKSYKISNLNNAKNDKNYENDKNEENEIIWHI